MSLVTKPYRPRSRRWTFTLFDVQFTGLDGARTFYHFASERRPIRFYVAQVEVTQSDRHHLQGYLEFGDPLDLQVVRSLNDTGHYEIARGDAKQNIVYCSKLDSALPGSQYSVGTPAVTTQGARNDLYELVEDCKRGATIDDVIEHAPSLYLRAHRIVDHLSIKYQRTRRDVVVESVVFRYGPTSTGKTTAAIAELDDLKQSWYLFSEGSSLPSFNGYTLGQSIIFDDFVSTTIPTSLLLKLLRPPGGCPNFCNTKGSFVSVDARYYQLTSNFTLDQLFTNDTARSAIIARITRFVYHPILGTSIECDSYQTFNNSISRWVPPRIDSRPPSPSDLIRFSPDVTFSPLQEATIDLTQD
jgi:hypothetical protein